MKAGGREGRQVTIFHINLHMVLLSPFQNLSCQNVERHLPSCMEWKRGKEMLSNSLILAHTSTLLQSWGVPRILSLCFGGFYSINGIGFQLSPSPAWDLTVSDLLNQLPFLYLLIFQMSRCFLLPCPPRPCGFMSLKKKKSFTVVCIGYGEIMLS